jgi:glycosyltransferase involved in cell wall biosynthesis
MRRTTPTLAVFTPAYNRAHTIERTYKSLCQQTNHDFMWVIVDDGSKDNTRDLCESWFADGFQRPNDNEVLGFAKDAEWLKIHYVYKENGGMHTAHNVAYEHIDTELAVCIDSDDWMPVNGVELIINKWRTEGEENFAGIIGLDIFEDGYVIGTCFPKDLHTCKTYDMGPKYGVVCDKKYVYRPEIIKRYLPYKVFPGERYGEVNYLYQQIDQDYDMLCGNDVYCIVDYQEDGLSFNVFNQHRQSPRTRAYECDIYMDTWPDLKTRVKKAIQYVSCAILAKDIKLLFRTRHTCLVWSVIPLGIAYNIYLRKQKLRNIDINKVKFYKYIDIEK